MDSYMLSIPGCPGVVISTAASGGFKVALSTLRPLQVLHSAQGPCVKSLPLGGHVGTLKAVPVKDLIALASKDKLAGGHLLSVEWLARTRDAHVVVEYADGNAANGSLSNLRVVVKGELDAPTPALPALCFARSGATICGAEATLGSHTCLAHKQHEALAARAQQIAQLCVFRAWLFSRKSAALDKGAHHPASVRCASPAACAACLALKTEEVTRQIQAFGSLSKYKWALDPMFGLFHPRLWFEVGGHRPHQGCCLAFAPRGARFCMKPVWQHNGVERLICMDHIIAHAAGGRYWEVEEAVKHHLCNYTCYLKGQRMRKDVGNPFMRSDTFNQLMGGEGAQKSGPSL